MNNNQESQIPERAPKKPNYPLRRSMAMISLGAVIGGGAFGVANANSHTETYTGVQAYTAESGDGLYDAAKNITGIDNVDIRDAVQYIETMPQNKEALSDGLQAGETISIPVNVK